MVKKRLINKRKITRRIIVGVLLGTMIISVDCMRHKGKVDLRDVNISNIQEIIDAEKFEVEKALVYNNTLHINISNKTSITNEECKDIGKKIFYYIKKDSLKDKSIVINFLEDCDEKDKIIDILYKDGLNKQLCIESNNKKLKLVEYKKEKVSLAELKDENIIEVNKGKNREVTICGEESVDKLENIQSIEQAIVELKN